MSNRPQPMPVADALCTPGTPVNLVGVDREVLSGDPRLVKMLNTAKRINYGCSPTWDELYKKVDVRRLHEELGPQRLPFTDMWFEGELTSELTTHVGRLEGSRWGVYGYADPYRWDNTKSVVMYSAFGLMRDGHIARIPNGAQLIVNADGVVENYGVVRVAPSGEYSEDLQPDDEDAQSEYWWTTYLTLPAMWAVGLMNCKNVKTEEVQRIPIKTKKMRRERGKNLLSYHTIVLPKQAHGGSGSGPSRGLQRLHMVRGHFATYTAEAPLFGRFVGTYWKPFHLAGNPDAGVIESDYKLEEQK